MTISGLIKSWFGSGSESPAPVPAAPPPPSPLDVTDHLQSRADLEAFASFKGVHMMLEDMARVAIKHDGDSEDLNPKLGEVSLSGTSQDDLRGQQRYCGTLQYDPATGKVSSMDLKYTSWNSVLRVDEAVEGQYSDDGQKAHAHLQETSGQKVWHYTYGLDKATGEFKTFEPWTNPLASIG